MVIRIIVDSTCDIPGTLIEQYGIEVLPLHVLAENREYLDRVTITTDEVYAMMRRGVMPKTAQVSITDTASRLAEFAARGEDMIYLAFSSKMSGTCGLVWQIMEDLKKQYPERKMSTLDAKGGSFGVGLIAVRAAKMASSGESFERIIERCRFLIEHIEHIFMVTDLTWMVRGGRISKTLGYTANILGIKPVLDVNDGEMEVIQKVRGQKRALERVAEIAVERMKNCSKQMIGIAHADDPEAAESLKNILQKRLPDCQYMIGEIGAVLGVHLGIGGVGVFFFNRLDPEAATGFCEK